MPRFTVPVHDAKVTVNRLLMPADDEGLKLNVAFVHDVVAFSVTVVLA